MGRVQFPPIGTTTANILGSIEERPVGTGYSITEGEFVQFVYENDKIVVIPANNRFNAEGIAIESGDSGSMIDIETVNDYDPMTRLSELKVENRIVIDNYVLAGEFIHITETGFVERATSISLIDGYALESGYTNTSIKIMTTI